MNSLWRKRNRIWFLKRCASIQALDNKWKQGYLIYYTAKINTPTHTLICTHKHAVNTRRRKRTKNKPRIPVIRSLPCLLQVSLNHFWRSAQETCSTLFLSTAIPTQQQQLFYYYYHYYDYRWKFKNYIKTEIIIILTCFICHYRSR